MPPALALLHSCPPCTWQGSHLYHDDKRAKSQIYRDRERLADALYLDPDGLLDPYDFRDNGPRV
jgi:hypothetical protein